jgi:D-arabinose 1-dehydrogenase-like Zn-dependent alcohol dehydrogenase
LRHADELAQNENGQYATSAAAHDGSNRSGAQSVAFWQKGVKGWAGGIPTDSQDTLLFAEMTGVRPMIEKYPLAKAAEGYARMMSGKAKCCVVLTM